MIFWNRKWESEEGICASLYFENEPFVISFSINVSIINDEEMYYRTIEMTNPARRKGDRRREGIKYILLREEFGSV